MLKDEFCTPWAPRCIILRGAVAALPLPRVGRCAPLVSTEALRPSGFIRGRRPLISSQPLAASWIVLAKGRFYKLVSLESYFIN